MNMKFLLLQMVLFSINCTAQNPLIKKLSQQVSQSELKKNLFFLASPEMEGRGTATKSDTVTSLFIANHFKSNGVQPAFNNGKNYFQAVPLLRKSDDGKSFLKIGNKNYEKLNGWYINLRENNLADLKDLPVVFAGYGIEHPNYNDFANIDVKGKAVVIMQGQPKNKEGIYVLSGTTSPGIGPNKTILLHEKSAAAILVIPTSFSLTQASLQQPILSRGFSTSTPVPNIQGIPHIYISQERANEILASNINSLQEKINNTFAPQSFEVSNNISIKLDIKIDTVIAPNVIGVIKGSDPNADAVILSAHHDHEGKVGNVIYPGAVDNASGTVAIMEIARLLNLAAKQGQRPKRTIIFASFTAEEVGLIGAYYLAENPVVPIEKTHAIINIDQMGRVDTFYSGRIADSMYAYILVKDSLNRGLREALFDAHETTGKELKLDTRYEQPEFMQRRLRGSDQYPFYLKGVPFIRIDCGFSKDYHKPTDTPDKINYELLQKQVRLAFLTTWNVANN